MEQHEITEAEVDGVDLVGDPANKRRFAFVKARNTPKEGANMDAKEFLKGLTADDLVEAVGEDKLRKALGIEGEPPAAEVVGDPATEDRTVVDLTKALARIEELEKASRDRAERELEARREALRKSNYEVAADASAEAVEALEQAHELFQKSMADAGLLNIHGGAESGGDDFGETLAKAVEEYLGRPPLNEAEAAIARTEIFKAIPGAYEAAIAAESV